MDRVGHPVVLFVAAAGPRRGFGHLVRCGVLADVLGAPRRAVLRASTGTRAVARRLGWTLAPSLTVALDRLPPDVIIVDDPRHVSARRAVTAARRAGVPVASIHDLGVGRVASDLSIDGSLAQDQTPEAPPHRRIGPAYAILHPSVRAVRRRVSSSRPRVLVALGGGTHIATIGRRIGAAIVAAVPGVRVDLAAGFDRGRLRQSLPPGCRWIYAPTGLADALAQADVAVVGGGVTLYEAAAIGTAAVAIAVVTGQRPTVRAFAARGLAAGVLRADAIGARAAAHQAVRLLRAPHVARAQATRARRAVDGGGAARVAALIRALADPGIQRRRHAA